MNLTTVHNRPATPDECYNITEQIKQFKSAIIHQKTLGKVIAKFKRNQIKELNYYNNDTMKIAYKVHDRMDKAANFNLSGTITINIGIKRVCNFNLT